MKRIIPIMMLIMFWMIFFWRQIMGGEVWYCCDNLLINIPSKVFLVQEFRLGRFPISNPYIFSGAPLWADINLALMHPNSILYFFFSPFRALTNGILVSFLIGSIGMYVLGRTLRMSRFAAVMGAIVFGFGGTLIVYANNIAILQVAVLVPWVIATWIGYLKTMTGRGLVMFVGVASLQILSGHPQLTYYTWLVMLGYTVWEKPSFQSAKLGLKAVLLIGLVTSAQVVPFVKFMADSSRVGQDFAAAASGSIHPLSLIRLLVPGIVGDLSRGTAWIQAGSMHGYVGILPFVFIPIAWRIRTGRVFVGLAIVSALLSMGSYTPVYWLAYHLIPGISFFREPGQFLFLWSFGMAGVVMVEMDTLMKKSYSARLILFIGLGLLLGAAVFHTQRFGVWELLGSARFLPDRLILKLSEIPGTQRTIITDGILYNLTLVGVFVVLTALATVRLRESVVAKTLVIGILFADLFVYGQTNVTTIAETTVSGWQEEAGKRIASWKLKEHESFRYYTDPAIYPYPDKKALGQWNDPGESEWQFKILRPNLGMLYGLRAVDGYASMVLRSYQKSFGSSVSVPTGVVIFSVVDPALARAGVRYIITKPDNILLTDQSRYTPVVTDGDIAVYEDKTAIPITFVKGIE